jgi:hypothetical protein
LLHPELTGRAVGLGVGVCVGMVWTLTVGVGVSLEPAVGDVELVHADEITATLMIASTRRAG